MYTNKQINEAVLNIQNEIKELKNDLKTIEKYTHSRVGYKLKLELYQRIEEFEERIIEIELLKSNQDCDRSND